MLLVAATIVGASGVAARADETGGSIGLSIAPVIGKHAESGLETMPGIVPIPILEATGRYRRFEVFTESLPGSPSVDVGFNTDANGTTSTHLSFFDGVARYYERNDRYWVGVGEIVYNQDTTSTQHYSTRDHIEVIASRVVGGRYELGVGLLKNAERVRLSVDLMPSVGGNIVYKDNFYRTTAAQPERGAQVETNLAIANARGPFSFRYGVRYINYSTRFTRNGSLADRDTGFLPYATFTYRFARSR